MISLKQGKQFNSYQQKMKTPRTKKTEGFVTYEQETYVRPEYDGYVPALQNNRDNTTSTNVNDQKDLDELKQLQDKYNNLMTQYTTLQSNIKLSSTDNINRVSSNNIYLGQNIQFTDGKLCYVTYQGIAKPYPDDETYNNTAGNNGCPAPTSIIKLNIPWSSEYIEGATIPTTPSLIVGSNMVSGQSCGFEGTNVRASKLINTPINNYVGCYNDKSGTTNTNLVPVMNSSNKVNGYVSKSSSVYSGNNNYGPWAAFNQNPNDWWHSDVSSTTGYNSGTGVYEGSNKVNIVNVGTVKGEYLQINMPDVNTSSAQNVTVNQYSIAPRLDSSFYKTRSPNSWYVLGYTNNQWYQVDRQTNQTFTNGTPKVYNVSTPGSYSAYVLLVDKVGNNDQTTKRNSVQVAEWNLYINADTDDQRAMIYNTIGYTTFDNCQSYAADNGYTYFGLQDYRSDGTAICSVSNDIAKTKIYGDATTLKTLVPIWSSNTLGKNAKYAKLGSRGRLHITTENNSLVWQATEPNDCIVEYSVTEQTDAPGNDLSHYTNTSLDECQQKCTDNSKCYGISLNTDTSNECWLKSQFKNIKSTSNRNLYQKVQTKSKCKFFLILQDDGNVSIYEGNPDKYQTPAVWSTMTNGKQLEPNSDWEASKSSFGRNYIIGGETLSVDQWIGSTNGSLKLIMQQDGNLVLFTSKSKTGCSKIDNKMYGENNINAVYELSQTGNRSSLGKVAYIDTNSKLMEYPDSMLGYSNNYQMFENTDSTGNDLSTLITTDLNGCQINCNDNPDCAAFVYQGSSTTCWLKNRETYPKAQKQTNNGVTMGVRYPSLKSSTTCDNKINNVDTIQYDNYVKGDPMTSDTQCKTPIISPEYKSQYDSLSNELSKLGDEIVSKMEKINSQNANTTTNLKTSSDQFKKNLEKYRETTKYIKEQVNFGGNNIEGMKNLNMNDLNGMLTDSDLRVLQENYRYVLWSVLAVGALVVTLKMVKK
jgi:hypothetical protein